MIELPTHKRFRNLTGQRFTRLTAVEFAGMKGARGAQWLCRCDCGTAIYAITVDLLSGNTRSCGCIKTEELAARNKTHGLSKTSEYAIWGKMLERCKNPKTEHYDRYGGRGIRVCERWTEFENFYADLGKRPSAKHEIDRIDNNGNYEPTNCRWVTKKQNARNRYTNRTVEFNGLTLCLSEWGERTGIRASTIQERLSAGWSIADTLTRPIKQYQRYV